VTVQRSGPPSEDALLTRLAALEAGHAAAPDQEWRATTRTRLVAMAAVRGPGPATGRRTAGLGRLLGPRRRTRLTAAVTGAVLTVAALGGVLAAAQGAAPGDLLYPVKRGGEQTRLALAADGDLGSTLLDLATTRLHEAGELVGVTVSAAAAGPSGSEVGLAAGPDSGVLVDTLATMDAQTTRGTAALASHAVEQDDDAALDELVAWAARQRTGLTELSPAVPDAARDAVAAAGRLVDDVAARGAALHDALACPAGPATDGADALGPRPAPCAPVTPPADPGQTTDGPDATSVGSRSSAPSSTSPPAAPTGSAARSTTARTPTGTAVPRPTISAPRPSISPPRPSDGAPRPGAPRPELPTPTLPSIAVPVPSVVLPPVPVPGATSSSSAAAPSSPGAVVQLPPVPGVRLCVPPVITVDCRSSGG
jgi:hypothetical protein